MKRLLILLTFLMAFPAVHAQQWEWAYPFTSYAGTKILSVKVSSEGEPYFMGWGQMQTTYNANNGPFVISGLNTFVAKFDKVGNIEWLSGGWGGSVWGQNMSIDNFSNCYITGQFGDTAYFGRGSDTLKRISWAKTQDYFLAKLDANGKAVFFKQDGNACGDIGTAVCAIPTDEAIVNWSDVLGCDHSDAQKTYMQKVNSNGNVIWSLNQPFPYSSGYIAEAPNSGFLLSGYWFGPSLKFDGVSDSLLLSPTNPSSISDAYLAKYSSAGNPIWAKAARGNNYQFTKAIFANNTGIYIALDTYDSCYYDSVLLLPKGERTQYILKADTSGNYIKHIGFPASINPTLVWIKDVKSDITGNIYFLARVNMPLQIGNDTIDFDRLPNEQAIAIVKLDKNLNYVWSQYLTYQFCNCWGGELAISDSLVYVGINYDGAVSLHGSNFQFPAPAISTSDNCFVAAIRNGTTPVDVKEISLSETITIFPNPSAGMFTVRFSQPSTKTEICVYDVFGNCIMEKKSISNLSQVVNLGSQSKGIYFVEIQSQKEKVVKKLVFQ